MGTVRGLLASGLFAVAALTCSSSALAADAEAQARLHFDRAVKLYEEGDFDAALAELKRSFELRPSPRLLYNIGQVRLAMHDYAAALEAYRQYLEKAGDQVTPTRRDMVQKEILRLEQRVAKLNVETDVPGAEVWIDDVLVGTTPLSAAALVNAGTRRVVVRHPDYLPQSQKLTLVGGAQEKLSFSLSSRAPATSPVEPVPASSAPRSSAAGPNPAATPPSAARSSATSDVTSSVAPAPADAAPPPSGAALTSRKVPWAAWGVTGVLAVGAGVVGGLTLSQNSSLKEQRGSPDPDPDRLHSDAKRVRTLAVVTDGLVVAALVGGAVSLWLTLDSSESAERKASRGRPLALNLKLGVGLDGIRVRSEF